MEPEQAAYCPALASAPPYKLIPSLVDVIVVVSTDDPFIYILVPLFTPD